MKNRINTSLTGKTVAVTGCTGGLGRELCFRLASMGADLIMLDRNQAKSQALEKELTGKFNVKITRIKTELECMAQVKSLAEELILLNPDIFVANAGAYSIPRHTCDSGFDNVFQINFVSHYYIASRLREENSRIRIVAVGSVAHRYSILDKNDIDFKTRKSSALVYGNSKRYLMLAFSEKFGDDGLAIVHPGITFTNITAHYPKLIFALIKHPMKIIFMKPKRAVESIAEGIFRDTSKGGWIGPRFFGVWGKPKISKFKAFSTFDRQIAYKNAEKIYNKLKTT